MYALKDNVVALATAPGKSALNIIRVSGDSALNKIFQQLTQRKKTPKPNTTYPYFVYNNNNQIIDQSVITYYKSPKSYTGEFMLEISVHGGYVITNQIIDLILKKQCRMAAPGEFTYRAFINNKINLIQAEAINGLINANSELISSHQINNLTGGLTNAVAGAHKELRNMLILAEHELDFSESEINLTDNLVYIKKLVKINKSINRTLRVSCYEKNVDYPRIVIVGEPNTGKSSLFNKIIGYDKAIVTNIQGTTRDVVEVQLNLRGKNINLMDTAGIRNTSNKIEKLGIQKTKEELQKANIVLVLDDFDPEKKITSINQYNKSACWISIINKIDKKKNLKKSDFRISCINNQGIEGLLTELSTQIDIIYNKNYASGKFMLNQRQNQILSLISAKTQTLIELYPNHKELVLLCCGLREILSCFDDLIRPIDNGEILNEIFGDFCVGK